MSFKPSLRLAGNARFFSRSAVECKSEVHPGYHKLKAVQERFQKPDGLPVHLKGGALDKVLYGTTVIACVAGLGGVVKLIYDLGYPKKED